MYKVFISDRPITLMRRQDSSVELRDGHLHFHASGKQELEHIVSLLENDKDIRAVNVYNNDPAQLFQDFKTMFEIVEAAGGVVENLNGEILFIHRRGSWDFPKGKLDLGESPEEAAVREVSEECGIPMPLIKTKLPMTFHTYRENGKFILKPTHWYRMKSDYLGDLTPEVNEGIVEARWVSRKHWRELAKHSYPNIAELIEHILS